MAKNIPLIILIFLPLIVLRCTTPPSDKNQPAEEKGRAEIVTLETIEHKDEDGNWVSFSRRISDSAKEGKYVRFSPDSVLMEIAFYHNDTLDGKRILFSEKGDTQIVETYDKGLFEGPYSAFYENGKMEFYGKYQRNSMEGVWKRYYESGQLMESVTFANNQENGPFVEYNENGTLKAEGNYKDGDNEDGDLRVYDENGVLIRKMKCKNGMCKTIWKKDTE